MNGNKYKLMQHKIIMSGFYQGLREFYEGIKRAFSLDYQLGFLSQLSHDAPNSRQICFEEKAETQRALRIQSEIEEICKNEIPSKN